MVDRRFALGVRTETYVDASRATSPDGRFPGAPDRTLPVVIWYPAVGAPGSAPVPEAEPDRRSGPYPLVVFAHGYAVTPEFFAEILLRWAAAGYVVAAPVYPFISGIPSGPSHTDYEQTFADTTFVITQLLRQLAGGPGPHPLAGTVDPQRIAAAGHSDGEAIAFGVGFLQCCRDPRVKAVIPMAGNLGNINNPVQRGNGVPILHFISQYDEFNPYGPSVEYDRTVLSAPKWSVTLLGASHTGPYVDPSSPYFDGVMTMTIDFLDGTLKDRPERLARIDAYVADHPDLFRLER